MLIENISSKIFHHKAKELGFNISNLLEQKATAAEREQGLDLADYLLRFNFMDFALKLKDYSQPVNYIKKGFNFK